MCVASQGDLSAWQLCSLTVVDVDVFCLFNKSFWCTEMLVDFHGTYVFFVYVCMSKTGHSFQCVLICF